MVWSSGGEVIGRGGSFETTLTDGSHTVTAAVTDAGGLSDSASVSVSVASTASDPVAGTIHVGGLTDHSTNPPGPNWDATAQTLVHDGTHAAAAGVTVTGKWANGTTATCVTGADGTCRTSLRLNEKKTTSTTFTVVSLARDGDVYDPAANHDPAQEEPTITLRRRNRKKSLVNRHKRDYVRGPAFRAARGILCVDSSCSCP